MIKLNCWEFKKCGRQPMGEKVNELGVCPVATESKAHGVNDGTNAGRSCWAIAGSFCGGKVQGSYAAKLGGCLRCDFFNEVRCQQASRFVSSKEILNILKEKKQADRA